jgi:hypothetical protein
MLNSLAFAIALGVIQQAAKVPAGGVLILRATALEEGRLLVATPGGVTGLKVVGHLSPSDPVAVSRSVPLACAWITAPSAAGKDYVYVLRLTPKLAVRDRLVITVKDMPVAMDSIPGYPFRAQSVEGVVLGVRARDPHRWAYPCIPTRPLARPQRVHARPLPLPGTTPLAPHCSFT